jgi:hypothetical protein
MNFSKCAQSGANPSSVKACSGDHNRKLIAE